MNTTDLSFNIPENPGITWEFIDVFNQATTNMQLTLNLPKTWITLMKLSTKIKNLHQFLSVFFFPKSGLKVWGVTYPPVHTTCTWVLNQFGRLHKCIESHFFLTWFIKRDSWLENSRRRWALSCWDLSCLSSYCLEKIKTQYQLQVLLYVNGSRKGWVIVPFIFNNAASTLWLQWSLTLYVDIGKVETSINIIPILLGL